MPIQIMIPTHPRSTGTAACAVALVYLLLVRALRWRRYNAIHKKYTAKYKAKTLTPEEAQEVIQVSILYDMPMLSEYSLAFALFKTYAIPTISRLLLATKQLSSPEMISRRYADTQILIATWIACPLAGRLVGVESNAPANDPRASIALARTNWLHSKYNISNDDYLYTLGLFMFEPGTWAERYGWRALSPLEQYASYVYWSEIGRKMNMKNIPPTAADFRAWIKEYEKGHMVPAESNRDVAEHTTSELLYPVPTRFHAFFEGLTTAMLDDNARVAMMQPPAPHYARYLVRATLGLVAFVQRHLLLPRWRPRAIVEVPLPTLDADTQAPRLHPTKWTAKPWYRPRGWYLLDRLLVLLRWHDDVPRPEYRCEGYRIHEMGPLQFEQDGHEEVMRMAAALQGCPIVDAWKKTEHATATATAAAT
ncbi:hypothetical protein GGX14DRAFT_463470 [Mycena pura]|uniref:ER-bound oxygenase mpaB/mpaB'/Rubber oxygenase catalytic domain-containing protein n=1 Tax=Mycena pura TaxID=153505 RepID=A0AAD6V883_9AGAR|nr:hypothetical protein GGX14DRAFT_463470 [Mycena pura]